jgi:hypothetical protein
LKTPLGIHPCQKWQGCVLRTLQICIRDFGIRLSPHFLVNIFSGKTSALNSKKEGGAEITHLFFQNLSHREILIISPYTTKGKQQKVNVRLI